MASEKLNQAFIKAYGKRKLPSTVAGQVGKQQSMLQDEFSGDHQDSLIVRFDTATVQSAVPPMHNHRPPRQGMAMSAASGKPQPRVAAQSSNNRSASSRNSDVRTALSTMTPSATDLSDEQAQESTGQAEAEGNFLGTELGSLVSSDDWSSLFGSTTMIFPQANLVRPSDVPSERKPTATGSTQARGEPETDSTLKPVASRSTDSKPAAPEQAESHSVESEKIDDKPGAEISASSESSGQDAVTNSRPEVIQQHIAAKNRDGDIVRLDSPNQSISADQIESQKSCAIESDDAAAETQRTKQRVLAAEEGLRRARKRIFNPLWEVDRLDWPRVSLELMAAIEDKSPGVAKNLSSACQDGLQILAVTSPVSGAGTSTVACCLAMLAGRHGMNIALVDGNLENPSLCYQTNLEIELDWHESISKRLPLEEVAVHSVDDQITMVPLLARLSAPQLNEQSIATVLQELSQSFDLVIVDLGPMTTAKNMVSALGSLGILNAVVTVVDRRQSGTANIESCLRQIRMSGISSIGLVENFAA